MKKRLTAVSIVILSTAALVACAPADSESPPVVDDAMVQAEVDAAMNGMFAAYGANDVEGYFDYFQDDATLMTNGGSIQPVADYHESWTRLIGGGGGVSSLGADAPRTIRLTDSGNTAVVLVEGFTAGYRFPNPENPGEFNDSSNVWTASITWSNAGGAWKIMHYHYHDATN